MMAARQQPSLRGTLLREEPMARHTSWRVGGPAQRYYQPADIVDLALFLAQLPADEPLYWVGLGSNLLVRDGGIRGTVIATSGMLNEISLLDDGRVRVESGVSCARVARYCAHEGLAGAEFLCGIPGTMGGALAMNAGCFGGETWRLVESLETMDRHGELRRRAAAEYEVGYRHVTGPAGEWFVATTLKLERGDALGLLEANRQLLERRSASQPTQQPNAGSVFRNPEGDFAARLIEAAGLKGRIIGKAQVSEKHANFIVNLGGASAADIESLIEVVRREVNQQHGVALQCEVRIIGEAEVARG
ncbi:MAG: UDP-N-acetylmuramate dehydrogenase [Gammaproteobacteria bacterium]|nr:UDP-N-acetylmuramate dehydrogenase [Gammaproteobacteria bacterium]